MSFVKLPGYLAFDTHFVYLAASALWFVLSRILYLREQPHMSNVMLVNRQSERRSLTV
jgi:hypothetical protein